VLTIQRLPVTGEKYDLKILTHNMKVKVGNQVPIERTLKYGKTKE
jgi:hypothetical protein